MQQNSIRNFKSKSGTRIIGLLVPLLFPKFVAAYAARYHELRKRGTSAGLIVDDDRPAFEIDVEDRQLENIGPAALFVFGK